MALLHSHTSTAPRKGFLKLQGALGKHIQSSSMKCVRLAPPQIQPPHADSWQITSVLQTPALPASDPIQANLLYPCCVCDLLGVPQFCYQRNASSHGQDNAVQLVSLREASLELVCADYK